MLTGWSLVGFVCAILVWCKARSTFKSAYRNTLENPTTRVQSSSYRKLIASLSGGRRGREEPSVEMGIGQQASSRFFCSVDFSLGRGNAGNSNDPATGASAPNPHEEKIRTVATQAILYSLVVSSSCRYMQSSMLALCSLFSFFSACSI